VAPLSFIFRDVLNGGAARLPHELREPRLMNMMAAASFDADLPYMFQSFDHSEHAARSRGFRHLTQPCQPRLAGVFPALRQRIETPPLFRGQPGGEPAMRFPPRLVAYFNTKPFKNHETWKDDTALPALFENQFREMHEPFIFDRLRQQP
jgi:hypothetical protein